MPYTERVVALIDMDCFYCQVEEKLDPNLAGKPIAVVQYNQWKGGGIIAVNYLAREKGVTRQMRGDEAKEKCPNIQLPRVPQVRGKADLTKYREAGKQVAEVLKSFTNILERASIDEAYLDLTEAVNTELKNGFPIISLQDLSNTFVVGQETADFLANISQNRNSGFYEDDIKLLVGGLIVEKIRAEVYKKTGYKCSAGIAHNKILAKLVCGLHKPNKQTILPQGAVPQMFASLPIRKIKSLGGKFGHILSETLNINYIGELLKFTEKELVQRFDEKTGRWLYNISRGIDRDPVQVKLISKSIGCCKRFPGRTSLCKGDEVEHWMKELSSEISDRLDEDLKENNRKGRLMTVSFSQMTNQTEISSTRAVPLKSYEIEKIWQQSMEVLHKYCQKTDGSYHITFLGLSIGNFEDIKNVKTITSYFSKINKVSPDPKKIESVSDSYRTNPDYMIKEEKSETKNKIEDTTSNKNCAQESDISDSDEKSVYSNTTIELEENPEDLIFYDDSLRSGSGENPIFTSEKAMNVGNMDLIEKVLTNASSEENSFRSRMYSNDFSSSTSPVLSSRRHDDMEDEIDSSKEIERDFDTSKIFDGHDEGSDDESEENIIASGEKNCNFPEPSENCKECGELIPIVDIVSHMDYHLALKLSQELHAPDSKLVEGKKSLNEKPPNKKRKVSEGFGSIQSFYKKQEIGSDEVTELCTECNKRIKIDDMVTHYDYHAAKKLHLELNSPSSKSETINNKISEPSSSSVSSRRNKKKINNGMNIASFFKPIDS
ncbi:DNApol-eta [Coccinella septempunctata]|uniref:DNApol-eta n=1 Tax=Coccinella septempunctata TaxID=41139 RepID=UPI001D090DA2|nr:DNApol-eta [Coccinella septempunctata]